MSLTRSSIDLAIDYKCAVLLNVDKIDLNILTLDIHDGKSLLPIRRSLRVCGLFEVH